MKVADSLSLIERINGKYVQTVRPDLGELLERAESLSLFMRISRIADSLSLIMRFSGKYVQTVDPIWENKWKGHVVCL